MKHLEENGFMASGQHGFRALRSILTQPLANWDSIMDGLVEGSPCVDAIYLDYVKVFDISYEILASVVKWVPC